MTVDGAVQKTSVLLALSALGAAYTWAQVASGNAAAVVAALNMSKIAGVVALVSAFATMLKPHWAQGACTCGRRRQQQQLQRAWWLVAPVICGTVDMSTHEDGGSSRILRAHAPRRL